MSKQEYEIDFDDLQKAFVLGIISIDQFVDVLTDNLGWLRTKILMKKNLKIAKKEERERNKFQASDSVLPGNII